MHLYQGHQLQRCHGRSAWACSLGMFPMLSTGAQYSGVRCAVQHLLDGIHLVRARLPFTCKAPAYLFRCKVGYQVQDGCCDHDKPCEGSVGWLHNRAYNLITVRQTRRGTLCLNNLCSGYGGCQQGRAAGGGSAGERVRVSGVGRVWARRQHDEAPGGGRAPAAAHAAPAAAG